MEMLEVVVTDVVAGRGAVSRSGHTGEWTAVMRLVRSRHLQIKEAYHAVLCPNASSCPGL